MKGGQNLRDLQVKQDDINPPICMVCNKTISGYYARYGNSGVCGRACMQIQDKVERFPGHSAEDLERTL